MFKQNWNELIEELLLSKEPSIRYKINLHLLNEDPSSKEMIKLQNEIKNSKRVETLLSGIDERHAYRKWQGAHWVLSLLADLHYPPGDSKLIPLKERVYGWLFSKKHITLIQTIDGRVRRCASQEGNAVYYLHALGLADTKTEELVERLIQFQWPDGGWNCDKKRSAKNSSYHESILPLRALIIHSKESKDAVIEKAILKAKEVFLKRELFISQRSDDIIHPNFVLLHYPYYWYYNILFALKVLGEGGFIKDSRCSKALNLIESKELPTTGFPAEIKYYAHSSEVKSRRSAVNWGGVRKSQMNEFVTSEVLEVLKKAGRL